MFKSFIRRKTKPQSRIHVELTEKARDRIASITSSLNSIHMEEALKKLQDDVGSKELSKFLLPYLSGGGLNPKSTHDHLIGKASDKITFSYLEHLLVIATNAISNSRSPILTSYYDREFLLEILLDINNVLVEEGILWELKIAEAEQEKCLFEFVEVSSVMQKDSDEELQIISLGTEWEESLKPFNEAYNTFLSGANSFVIPEKLYRSFEEIIKKICKDNDFEVALKFKLSAGIETIKEKDFFGKDNKALALEIQDLVNLLEKHTSTLGGDRKRHVDIDRYYCNLLLHQSSAWLVFLIKKSKDFRTDNK